MQNLEMQVLLAFINQPLNKEPTEDSGTHPRHVGDVKELPPHPHLSPPPIEEYRLLKELRVVRAWQ